MPLDKREYDLVCDVIALWDAHPEKFNDFERSFITGKGDKDQYDSFLEKHEKYGEDMKLSDKQIGVLAKIVDKFNK